MDENLATFLDAAEACPGWADADRQFSYKDTLTDMVRAVVAVCEEWRGEGIDLDMITEEIDAALEAAMTTPGKPPHVPPPKPKVCVGPCNCPEAT